VPVDTQPRDIPVLLLYNIDIDWTAPEQEESACLARDLGQAIQSVGHPVTMVPVTDGDLYDVLHTYDPLGHIVFNWCEDLPGVDHSEWVVARCLELLGFVFTGADSSALAVSQHKHRVKQILGRAGIPVPRCRLHDGSPPVDWSEFPAIVKPANEHCSEGISRESVVLTREELAARTGYVAETYGQPALVENFIDGREFHVSLWGNGRIEVLPVAEMDFSFFNEVNDRLCTYESKHVPQSLHYQKIETLLPAPLTEDELAALERVSMAAYRALGCRDYARIDLRAEDGVFYVLDVNPNADISADASLACAAEVAGYSYGEMASRLVRLAARRHPVWGKPG